MTAATIPAMKPCEFLLQMAVADMFDAIRNTVLPRQGSYALILQKTPEKP
jgi:hypothetical protein